MKLSISKIDASRLRMVGAGCLYSWASYEISLRARDFVDDQSNPVTMTLERNGDVYASCAMVPDPLRRDVRTGVLVVGDAAHASLFDSLLADRRDAADIERVGLLSGFTDTAEFVLDVSWDHDNGCVLHATVPVCVRQRTTRDVVSSGTAAQVASTADMVSHATHPMVSTSTYTGIGPVASVSVRDRTNTMVVLDLRSLSKGTTVVVVPKTVAGLPSAGTDAFEAWVTVKTIEVAGCARARTWSSAGRDSGDDVLGDVLVGPSADSASAVAWDYFDSATLPSSTNTFTIHLERLPGTTAVRGAFRVDGAVPSGVEMDPDSTPVPGAGVANGE